ncbi:MAG: DMT family transporter [Clostridiales bacterium]
MYSWLQLTLISGIFLGLWDIAKKKALSISPLFYVLALYTTFCFIFNLYSIEESLKISKTLLLLIFIKSLFVVCCWILNFTSIKNLPISIITPFNTLTPLFTILIGTLFLHERINLINSIGILIMLTAYYFISKTSNNEVTGLFKNKYFYLVFISTFLSALSAILDKIILQETTPEKIQFWFCFFIAFMYWIILIYTKFKTRKSQINPTDIPLLNSHQNKTFNILKKHNFNIYIIIMSILLFLADRIYFIAINQSNSVISIIMPVRSISIVVSSIIGGFIFKEKNLKTKLICTILIIIGIAFIFS